MAYTASQNPKTGTTYMAAALFATLILLAGIAALAMQPAEAFAKPLCDENGPCYASVNTNAADSANSLCNSMACMRSAIEGKLCAKRCLSGNGPAFIDENDDGICDNYENGLCPGNGLGYGNGNGLGNGSGTQNGSAYGYGSGNGYGACANGGGCGYTHGNSHGACSGFVGGCQRAQNFPNR
ncbi:hypothetical protein [Slackia isoflavoniconvertens]|uniref:hypothetical protein n=1 Tax=Slackia isoflavoniconvertens TaxID=572010 RepID=UPI002E781965|nr:hypothetical protein [Slackia isoflavoniconvertens]